MVAEVVERKETGRARPRGVAGGVWPPGARPYSTLTRIFIPGTSFIKNTMHVPRKAQKRPHFSGFTRTGGGGGVKKGGQPMGPRCSRLRRHRDANIARLLHYNNFGEPIPVLPPSPNTPTPTLAYA